MVLQKTKWDGVMNNHENDTDGSDFFASPLEGVTIESIQITLDLYKSGKAGVPIDTLWQFACPIFDHYQLELDIDPNTEVRTGNVEDMTLVLDILETASMIWDFCCLGESEKKPAREVLRANLLGNNPSPGEKSQFSHLLGSMELLWSSLSQSPIPSDSTQKPCNDHGSSDRQTMSLAQNGSTHYGPDKLDIPDAFALFSRPLIDNDLATADPLYLEDAMMRAQAYWDLAHAPRDQFDHNLESLVIHINQTSTYSLDVKEEALFMIKHFKSLFPERT